MTLFELHTREVQCFVLFLKIYINICSASTGKGPPEARQRDRKLNQAKCLMKVFFHMILASAHALPTKKQTKQQTFEYCFDIA